MPCRDGGDLDPSNALAHRLAERERMLCAAMKFIDARGMLMKFYHGTDWFDAGVPEDAVRQWWREHKDQDAERQERTLAARRRQRHIAAAMAKLTDEEREALGLTK